MSLTSKALLAGVVLLLTARSAIAHEICDPFRSPRVQPQLANCESLVRRNLVPNKAALKYTVKYFVENQKGFKDPSCATSQLRSPNKMRMFEAPDVCVNCQSKEWVEKGIQNNCSFVINDLQTPWEKHKNGLNDRSTAYYVDLCATQPSQLVSKFYINGAKQPPGDDVPREYLDTAPSNSSVLAGAFMMNGQMFNDFRSGKPQDYASIASKYRTCTAYGCDTGVPAIRMVGLNSSNNNTEFDKPFHISAYNRGNGCPGVSESTYPIMQKIVARGTSLYMSYNGKKFEQRGNSCVNDSSDRMQPGGRPQTLPPPARSTASANLSSHRSIFEITDAKSKIVKLQVDIKEQNGSYVADAKVLTSAKTSVSVHLICHKSEANEYHCRRGDNGGGFSILVEPKPRMTLSYFSADEEGNEELVLRSEKNKLLIIEGKTSPISSKDAF